jgi:thiamine-monophosphate kinase
VASEEPRRRLRDDVVTEKRRTRSRATTSDELTIVEWIRTTREELGPADPDLLVGIGDDCAVLRGEPHQQLLAVDTVVESVHFAAGTRPEDVGHKALARNLSDIAAMGGVARYALVVISCPAEGSRDRIQGIFRGIDALARRWGVRVIGGDLSSSPGPLMVTITVTGRVEERALLRGDAVAGQRILVTGTLGGSRLGHHLSFTPRLAEGRILSTTAGVGAAIDLSDGIARDLGHITRSSRVGAVLDPRTIPLSAAARQQANEDGLTALHHALHDGEDYELLFTADRETARALSSTGLGRTRVTDIGEIVPGPGVWLLGPDGAKTPLEGGHDHFRG